LNCPVYSLNAFWQFIEDYKWFWGSALIIVGIPLCLFGRKLFAVTLFLIGTIITMTVFLLVFYSTFLKDDTAHWIGWVACSCTILAGLLGGFLLYKCQRLGACCIAGWGGFMGGVLINTTFMFAAKQEWLFWMINISAALVAAGLAFCFFFKVIILCTSFAGAYFVVRGISLYAGGFPNEFELIKELENGVIPHISYWFYMYLGFILIFTVVGTVV